MFGIIFLYFKGESLRSLVRVVVMIVVEFLLSAPPLTGESAVMGVYRIQ